MTILRYQLLDFFFTFIEKIKTFIYDNNEQEILE